MRLWDFFMFMSMSAENHRLEASLSLSFIERWYFTCLSFFAYQDKPPARWKKENYILGIMKAVKQWCVQHCLRWTHLIWASESDPLCSRHSRVLFLQSISASSIFFWRTGKQSEGDWLRQRYQLILSVVPSIQEQMPFWNEYSLQWVVELSNRQQSVLKKSLQKLLTLWG